VYPFHNTINNQWSPWCFSETGDQITFSEKPGESIMKKLLTISIMVVLIGAMHSVALAQSGWEQLAINAGMQLVQSSGLFQSAGNAASNVITSLGQRGSELILGQKSVEVNSLDISNYATTGTNTAILGTVQVGEVSLGNVKAGDVSVQNYASTGTNTAILGTVAVGNVTLENLKSTGSVSVFNYAQTGTNTAILGDVRVGNVNVR
jgi:hypothetical protein